jgi:hypothetical protein
MSKTLYSMEIEKQVYMYIPPWCTTGSQIRLMYKLQKVMYRFKKSPCAWFRRFSSTIKKHGFKQSNLDHTLFLKQEREGNDLDNSYWWYDNYSQRYEDILRIKKNGN